MIQNLNSLLFISSNFSMCFVRLHPSLKSITTMSLHNNNYPRADQVSAAARAHKTTIPVSSFVLTCWYLAFLGILLSMYWQKTTMLGLAGC